MIAEFEEGLARGHKEFALIGTDLGAYGRDNGNTLADLLREMVKRDGDYEIMLRDHLILKFMIEMLPEFFDIFGSGRVSYMSSAVESGCEEIIKAMNRGYTAKAFKEALVRLKNAFPDIQSIRRS